MPGQGSCQQGSSRGARDQGVPQTEEGGPPSREEPASMTVPVESAWLAEGGPGPPRWRCPGCRLGRSADRQPVPRGSVQHLVQLVLLAEAAGEGQAGEVLDPGPVDGVDVEPDDERGEEAGKDQQRH